MARSGCPRCKRSRANATSPFPPWRARFGKLGTTHSGPRSARLFWAQTPHTRAYFGRTFRPNSWKPCCATHAPATSRTRCSVTRSGARSWQRSIPRRRAPKTRARSPWRRISCSAKPSGAVSRAPRCSKSSGNAIRIARGVSFRGPWQIAPTTMSSRVSPVFSPPHRPASSRVSRSSLRTRAWPISRPASSARFAASCMLESANESPVTSKRTHACPRSSARSRTDLTRRGSNTRLLGMRAWRLNGGFGFENLRLEQCPEPSCGPTQVMIRVRAVSLNARDVMMAHGEYNPRQKLPLVVCSDAAGEVVQVGSEVENFRVGQRVCPIFAGLWQSGPLTQEARRSTLGGPLDGTLREYFVADASAVVALPERLSFLEGACLPCAAVTAYRGMIEFAQLQAGQWLVCLGTGGVSLAALGIARALGIRVILTSRSAEKLARAAALGAEHGIDTSHTLDWGK